MCYTSDMKKLFAAVAIIIGSTFTVTACSPAASPSVDFTASTTVIDVRTPAEFAEGHLEGAVNSDVSAPTFASEISQLPVDGEYVIYCRSGNRSAQAVSQMTELGFTNLTDVGGVQQASAATGLPVVK